MFALNGTCVIFIVLFFIFIHLLNKIMLQPIGLAIEKRDARVKDNLDATRACVQETEELLVGYKAKLHASRLKAQALIQSTLAEAQKERDEKLKNIEAEGHKKINDMKSGLFADRKNLIQSLIHPELELVKDILHKLLGDSPTLVTSEERVAEVLESTR